MLAMLCLRTWQGMLGGAGVCIPCLQSSYAAGVSLQAAAWAQTDFIGFCVWQGEGGRDAEAKIGGLVLEAVSAVAKEDAAGLWILGLQTYRSLGIPRQGLLDQLQLFLALSRKGPLRVRCTSSLGAV